MSDVLTMDEIRARYAPDWVLIGDLVTDEGLEVVTGRVLYHSPDPDAVYRKVEEFRPGRFAVSFLGERPKDMEFLL